MAWRMLYGLTLRNEIDRQVNRPKLRRVLFIYTLSMNIWMTMHMACFVLAVSTDDVSWLNYAPAFFSTFRLSSWHDLPMLLCGNLLGLFIGIITHIIYQPPSRPASIAKLFAIVHEWVGVNVEDILEHNHEHLRKATQDLTVGNCLRAPRVTSRRAYDLLNSIYRFGVLTINENEHQTIVPIKLHAHLQYQYLPKDMVAIIRCKAFVLWILCEVTLLTNFLVLFIAVPMLLFAFLLPVEAVPVCYLLYVLDLVIVFAHFTFLFRLLLCVVFTFHISYFIILLAYHHLNQHWRELVSVGGRGSLRRHHRTKGLLLREVMSMFVSHVRQTTHTIAVNGHTSLIVTIFANLVTPFLMVMQCNFLLQKFETNAEKVFYAWLTLMFNFILGQVIAINVLITKRLHAFAYHFVVIEERLRVLGIVMPLTFRLKYATYYERLHTNTNMVAAEFIGVGQITAPKLLNYWVMYAGLLLSLANLLR